MPVEVVELFIKSNETYGRVFGGLVLILIISIWFLCIFVKNQSDKYLEQQKSNIQQIASLYLRNEDPRKQLLFNTIERSDKIRLDIYSETYSMFYYIRHNLMGFKENNVLANEARERLDKLRERTFINSIYLGELALLLLDAQICLSDSIENTLTGKLQSLYSEKHQLPVAKALTYISEAEKWIINNMKTTQTQSQIDISEDIINKIMEKQSQVIEKQLG